MDEQKRFDELIALIPDDVITEVSKKSGVPNPKTSSDRKDPYFLKSVLEIIYFWSQREAGALKVGKEIGDIGEKLGIFSQDGIMTPQEDMIIGGSAFSYQRDNPYKPEYLINIEIFRGQRPELCGEIDKKRQSTEFGTHPMRLGEDVKRRAKEYGKDFVDLSVEPLGADGRTVSDFIILNPEFVDVEMDKKKVFQPREPLKVISGEVLYKRLVEQNGYKMGETLPALGLTMNGEALEAWGFQKYKIGEKTNYVGKVLVNERPLLLGYAGAKSEYRLVNLPGISLEDAKPCVPLLRNQ